MTSGPAGRLAALYASLCLRFWSEFRGIPPREPLICFRRKRKKEKDTPKRRERAKQGASPRHATPLSSRCCTAVSLPFLPVPVPVLCGRLLHRAPLVLPARPRADRTTLLLSRHQHTLCLVGEFTLPLGHLTESRPLLPSQRQRTSTRQNNKSCASRSTHVVVDMRSTVLW